MDNIIMKYTKFVNEYYGMIDLTKKFKTDYRIKTVKYKNMKLKMLQYKDGKNIWGSDVWKYVPNYDNPKNINVEPSTKLNDPFRYIYSYNDAVLQRWIEEHPMIDRYFEENRLRIRKNELDKKHHVS